MQAMSNPMSPLSQGADHADVIRDGLSDQVVRPGWSGLKKRPEGQTTRPCGQWQGRDLQYSVFKGKPGLSQIGQRFDHVIRMGGNHRLTYIARTYPFDTLCDFTS